MKPTLTPEQHDSYQRDGFLVLEDFFDPSELEILYADFNDVVENWANIYYKGDYKILTWIVFFKNKKNMKYKIIFLIF